MILELVLATSCVAGCAAPVSAALYWFLPRVRRLQERQVQQERTIERLQWALEGVGREALLAGSRGTQVQQELAQLRERQQRMEGAAPGPRPYTHAIRLVRGGARIEDLVAACGLTHAEAELIASIHQHKERSASATPAAGTANVRAARVSG